MAAVGDYCCDARDAVDCASFVPTLLEARWRRRLAWGANLECWASEGALVPDLALVKNCYCGGAAGVGGVTVDAVDTAVGAGNLPGGVVVNMAADVETLH